MKNLLAVAAATDITFKEAEMVKEFLGLLLRLRSSSCCSSRSSGSSSSWSSSNCCGGKLLRIRQKLLHHLSLLEGDVGGGGHGQEVLHAVDDGVRNGGDGGVADGQRDGSDVGHSLDKLLTKVVIRDVENGGVKH